MKCLKKDKEQEVISNMNSVDRCMERYMLAESMGHVTREQAEELRQMLDDARERLAMEEVSM